LIRNDQDHGWAADKNWDEFADVFSGMEDLAETLDELIFSYGQADINGEEGWSKDNVPEGWYRIINDIDGSLKNLVREKYSDSDGEDFSGKIGTAVAGALKNQKIEVNVYVDGEKMTDGVNTRLGSMLASGLFG